MSAAWDSFGRNNEWFSPRREEHEEGSREARLLKRLLVVGGELGELRKDFYPLLMDDTSAMGPQQLVQMLTLAFDTYYDSGGASIRGLKERADKFIDALIPEDTEKALEAKRLWHEAHPETYSSLQA